MQKNISEKQFVVFFLLIAMYLTIICPCDILLSCHRHSFLIAVIIPLVYIYYINYMK